MKKLLLIVVMSFMAQISFAQLSGRVTDANTKEKIQGAVVRIENSFLVCITDAEGKYSFNKIKEASVKISVTHLSYQNFSAEVSLPNESFEIALERKTYLSDEVTVSATRAADNSPTAFTNVSKKEIEDKNLGQDIPFLLSTTPSVVVTSDAGNGIGYSGIRIRGSDATRVNVTINGIPVNDAESHQVYWVDMPDLASSIDNIQIQRGIGTSTNGAGAFGASVNIQSSTLKQEAFGEVNSSYGSFNTLKNTASFGTGLLKNKFAFDGRLSKINSDGYIDRATSDLKSFYLNGGYYGSKSTLRAIIFSGKEKTYQAWYGVPQSRITGNMDSLTNHYYNNLGSVYQTEQDSVNLFSSGRTYNYYTYKNQTDNYQQDNYQLLYSFAENSNLILNAALHYTKGKGYYEEYKLNQSLADYKLDDVVLNDSTIISSSDLIRQLWLDNNFYGYTFSANYSNDKLQLTFGGAGNRYAGRHYDEVIWAQYFSNGTYPHIYDDNDATKDDINFFAKACFAVTPKLNLFGDVQSRMLAYSFFGFDNALLNAQQKVTLSFFNPKAGISFDINSKNKVYASAAVGNKEPMRDDYVNSPAYNFPKPEEMTDVEAGYKYSGDKIRAAANFYWMNYKNQLILTGKINDVGDYTRQNVPESFRRGVEAEFAYSALKNLSLAANITLSENKIKTFEEFVDDYDTYLQQLTLHKNSDIAFSPSIISSATITYSPIKNFAMNFVTHYVGEQYLDNTSNTYRKIDAYLLNDFFLSYHFSSGSVKDVALKFGVYNLFNTLYEANGYTYSYYYSSNLITENYFYPQAGVNWLGGVAVKL